MSDPLLPDQPSQRPPIRRAQWSLAAIIVAVAVGAFLYRLLVMHRLEQTAVLFIALPSVLAIILALTPQARSATGMILKGITIALLISGPLLGEGFICIVMAAPLFYLVGAVIGVAADWGRRNQKPGSGLKVALIPLLLGMEGATPQLTFPTHETVTVSRVLDCSVDEVERSLARRPAFARPLPLFFRLKFPIPESAAGSGLTIGSERTIHFGGGEGKPGDLTLRVAERGARTVRFDAVSDHSHISHWLTWRNAIVEWAPTGDGKTAVRWTLVYDRELDPAWYFGPWERYAARLAGRYLIENVATSSP